jgi:hypothetical protein
MGEVKESTDSSSRWRGAVGDYGIREQVSGDPMPMLGDDRVKTGNQIGRINTTNDLTKLAARHSRSDGLSRDVTTENDLLNHTFLPFRQTNPGFNLPLLGQKRI